ncbi:uncharacterized protein L3040_004181 [Drepanopeziza brunnea f. sp. 'multigermtubi']|uniref:uncharacterized protein n=1 Tax=Drepanopeziza brunnea f. sp. 'multigermtubi' TaxID=698441 RepID=UPI00238AB0A4|nr:hypothetical protein L3040_004181 [Drepanopeziza brunnea f. sp. 'multigermtubi']
MADPNGGDDYLSDPMASMLYVLGGSTTGFQPLPISDSRSTVNPAHEDILKLSADDIRSAISYVDRICTTHPAPKRKAILIRDPTSKSFITYERCKISGSIKVIEDPIFAQFARFPKEIRRKVWRLSLPGPRMVELNYNPSFHVVSPTRNPIQLQICHESREEALMKLDLVFRPGAPNPPIYVHASTDTLYFSDQYTNQYPGAVNRGTLWAHYPHYLFCMTLNMQPTVTQTIKHLAINLEQEKWSPVRCTDTPSRTLVLARFPNLASVSAIVESKTRNRSNGSYLLVHPGAAGIHLRRDDVSGQRICIHDHPADAVPTALCLRCLSVGVIMSARSAPLGDFGLVAPAMEMEMAILALLRNEPGTGGPRAELKFVFEEGQGPLR